MPEEDTSTRYQGVIRTLLDQNAYDKELICSNHEEIVVLKAKDDKWRQAKVEWDIERLELKKKIELLELSAVQREETIVELRCRNEKWESRYLELVDDLKRQSELWSSEFAKFAQTFARQPTPLESSTTAVPSPVSKKSAESSSPAKTTSSGKVTSIEHSRPPPALLKLSSDSTLLGKRHVITAEYEVKRESDEEERPVLSSGSKRSSYGGDSGDAPARKRRRKTSAKRVEDEEYEGSDTDQDQSREDFDEMAIGAEDNHKEIYGHRRVHVREIGVVHTPPQKTHARSTAANSGSSGKNRRVVVDLGTPNVRIAPR